MSASVGAYVVLYDRDCGICSAFGRVLRALDLVHRIRIETIQESRSLLRGVPEAHILDAFHVVSPDGTVTTGGDAVPSLIEALPAGGGPARLIRGSSRLTRLARALYAFLARFRDALVCRLDVAATSAGPRP